MSAIALLLSPDAANKNNLRNKDKYLFIDSMQKFSLPNISFYSIRLLALLPQLLPKDSLYNGRFSNTSAIMYTWDGKHLYCGRFTNTFDILYTWDGKYLYKGGFSNTADILYTFDGKHLYRGRFTNTSDILLTFGAQVPVIIMLLKTI